jgi:hypothetical protein
MSRRVAILAGALVALALPATAAADTTLNIKDGVMTLHSEDPSVANEFTIETRGDRVYITEPKDVQGINNQAPAQCSASEFNSAGASTQVHCAKSSVQNGIVLEPGPESDSIKYLIADIPLALAAGSGIDKVTTADAADDLSGDQGNDSLASGNGDDILNGDDGNDTLDGGAGNDKLTGGNGTDTFAAGPGDDTVVAADGLNEKIDCGDGTDTVTGDATDEFIGCENVTTQNITGVAPQPAADDGAKPTVQVGGSNSQRARKSVSFIATCSEAGVVQSAGYLDAGGINAAMKPSNKKVDVGGGGVTVTMKFTKRHLKAIKKDLRKKKKPRVRVTISCADTAGNTSIARKFWISLRK